MRIVYGAPASQFTRKVQVFLIEKGIEYKLEQVIPMTPPPGYEKLHPMKRIPVYQDDEVTLPDSSVICAYLERKQPDPSLYPKNDADYARALWLEEYSDTALPGAMAWKIFMNIVVRPRFLNRPVDEEMVKEAMEKDIPPVFEYLEENLGDSEFIVGGAFSIADIGIATQLANFLLAGKSIDAARWPKLAAYTDRILARPSFAGLIAQEKAFFGV